MGASPGQDAFAGKTRIFGYDQFTSSSAMSQPPALRIPSASAGAVIASLAPTKSVVPCSSSAIAERQLGLLEREVMRSVESSVHAWGTKVRTWVAIGEALALPGVVAALMVSLTTVAVVTPFLLALYLRPVLWRQLPLCV
jgi:hypothetical protein